MASKYIAGRRIKVGHGYREPGDEVPEAAEWRNLRSYISFGSIRVVDAGEEAPSPAPDPEPVEEPVAEEESTDDLGSLKKAELVALAEEQGLDTDGTKADLIDRLTS